MLPIVQSRSVERVEHQLAREAEQVERARPVLGEEAAGGREVLPEHDLVGLDRPVRVRSVAGGEPYEGLVELLAVLEQIGRLS